MARDMRDDRQDDTRHDNDAKHAFGSHHKIRGQIPALQVLFFNHHLHLSQKDAWTGSNGGGNGKGRTADANMPATTRTQPITAFEALLDAGVSWADATPFSTSPSTQHAIPSHWYKNCFRLNTTTENIPTKMLPT
jgi:hypothetical protein